VCGRDERERDMAHVLKLENTVLNLELQTDKEINDDSKAFRALYQYLTSWGAYGQLKEINFTRDAIDPFLYEWRAERKAGGVLLSAMTFASGEDVDPEATISLTTPWPLSVMIGGTPTRAQLMNIRASHGLISFTCEFA
jgi:hypothetical protein